MEAANGREALRLLEQGGVEGVVSDILMPGMDGFRLCYEIRRTAALGTRIPVVLYTGTFGTAADRELAQRLGASGFLCKPAAPAAILATLKQGAECGACEGDGPMPALEDTGVLEYYNRALVRKLEERSTELQSSITQIHRAHQQILELNHALETRVEQRTAALAAASSELEAISRTIVYGLQTPLRAVAASAHLIESTSAATNAHEFRRYATSIVDATRHMTRLLDSLCEFIRLGNSPVSSSPLDLDALVESAISAVRADIEDRNIRWERHTLARAQGDPALLLQVLSTLIRNAVKYTIERKPAIIEIGSRRGCADEVIVFVRDNGLGFEARTQGSRSESLGRASDGDLLIESELALANAHRIVGRHGGRLWCEAAVGGGMTCYFSLPQACPRTAHATIHH